MDPTTPSDMSVPPPPPSTPQQPTGRLERRSIIDLSQADVSSAAMKSTLDSVHHAFLQCRFSPLLTTYSEDLSNLKARHLAFLRSPAQNPVACERIPVLGKIIRFFYNLYVSHKVETLFKPVEMLIKLASSSTPTIQWDTSQYHSITAEDLTEQSPARFHSYLSPTQANIQTLDQIEEYLTKGDVHDARAATLLQNTNRSSLLFLALEHDSKETIRFLVREGTSPLDPLLFTSGLYAPLSTGNIPLSALGMAIRKRDAALVKMLLDTVRDRNPSFCLPDDNAQHYNAKYHDGQTQKINDLLQTYR